MGKVLPFSEAASGKRQIERHFRSTLWACCQRGIVTPDPGLTRLCSRLHIDLEDLLQNIRNHRRTAVSNVRQEAGGLVGEIRIATIDNVIVRLQAHVYDELQVVLTKL